MKGQIEQMVNQWMQEVPLGIFFAFLLDICKGIATIGQFNRIGEFVFRQIFVNLLQKSPQETYYSVAQFSQLIRVTFFEVLETRLKQDLPRNFMTMEFIGQIIQKYSE